MPPSLFRAGISPLRVANRISRERYRRLVPAIRETLADAITAGGSSIRDYVHSDGGAGCFQVDCAVYGRAGEPCRRCGGVVRSRFARAGGRPSLSFLPTLKGVQVHVFVIDCGIDRERSRP